MKFRRGCFTVLAIVAAIWIIFGMALTARVADAVNDQNSSGYIGYGLAAVLGGGVTAALFLCTGIPVLGFAVTNAYFNHQGLRRKRMGNVGKER